MSPWVFRNAKHVTNCVFPGAIFSPKGRSPSWFRGVPGSMMVCVGGGGGRKNLRGCPWRKWNVELFRWCHLGFVTWSPIIFGKLGIYTLILDKPTRCGACVDIHTISPPWGPFGGLCGYASFLKKYPVTDFSPNNIALFTCSSLRRRCFTVSSPLILLMEKKLKKKTPGMYKTL